MQPFPTLDIVQTGAVANGATPSYINNSIIIINKQFLKTSIVKFTDYLAQS